MLKRLLTPRWILTTLFVLAGIGLCLRLGFWQLDRLEQRRAFNEHYLAVRALPVLELTAAPEQSLREMEYRAVTATGVYDFENQVALRNRYYERNIGAKEYGYHLLTPLILADGTAILVDRGWIPAEGNATPADWRKYDRDGVQTISGILRLGQTQPEVGGVPDPPLAAGQTRLDFWNLVNLERISAQSPYPMLDVFLQPNPTPGDQTLPIAFQPEIVISEGSHEGYAAQWFTFAAMLLVGYPFFVRQQLAEEL
jgi:surfeit locus 1 family protein